MALETDYHQHLYRHKDSDIKLALGKREGVLTEAANHPSLVHYFKERGAAHLGTKALVNFSINFTHIGLISPEEFYQNLCTIRTLIPAYKKLILINAPTPPPGHEQRYEIMNQMVDDFIENNENTQLVDLRKLTNTTIFSDNGSKNFNRKTYLEIASLLLEQLPDASNESVSKNISPFLVFKNEIRMRYLVTKSFLRKNVWMKIKRFNLLLALELYLEDGLAEIILSCKFIIF